MKKLLTITGFITLVTGFIACGGAKGNDPGRAYMPDMYYSRAYEAFGYNNLPEDHDLKRKGIYYTGKPVPGTIARGDAFSFPIPAGDSGYALAAGYRNATMDTTTLNPNQMIEAERLYLIFCGICHGTALDGNGPLWKGGDGPFPAAPRNLLDDYTKALSDGQMYHVITYGKGQMGSYASQVHAEQRWWLIKYMRSKQSGEASGSTTTPAAPANGAGVAAPATDTTKAN
jgi:mono/diheme cytochrome c family protein